MTITTGVYTYTDRPNCTEVKGALKGLHTFVKPDLNCCIKKKYLVFLYAMSYTHRLTCHVYYAAYFSFILNTANDDIIEAV